MAELADAEGYEGGFNTTYQPSRHEEGWLLESLRSFYDREMITDVLAQVKGGKEANVYACTASPAGRSSRSPTARPAATRCRRASPSASACGAIEHRRSVTDWQCTNPFLVI